MDNQNNTTPEYNGPQKICKHCKKQFRKFLKRVLIVFKNKV